MKKPSNSPEQTAASETLSGPEPMTFTEMDAGWLQELTGREIGQDDLKTIQLLFDRSSRNARNADQSEEVRASRRALVAFMGWDSASNAFSNTYQKIHTASPAIPSEKGYITPNDAPLSIDELRVFNVAKTLYDEGLNFTLMFEKFPSVAKIRNADLEERIEYLRENDLPVKKILEKLPNVAAQKLETTKGKFEALADLGLDAPRVVDMNPVALGYASDSVLDKMASLENLGFDAATLINRSPKILDAKIESLQTKIRLVSRYLKTLDVDVSAQEYITEHPSVLKDSIRKLGFAARAYADYGTNENPGEADVRFAAGRSPESMIIDIAAEGAIDNKTLTSPGEVAPENIRETVLDLVTDPNSGISHNVRRSYLRARPLNSAEAAKYDTAA